MHRNMINDKKYIGITSRNVDLRWQNGLGYKNTHFGNAIKKYGWENFEHIILFEGLNKEQAFEKEKELIKKYDTTNRELGYNRSTGGSAPALGMHHSEKTKDYLKKYGKEHSYWKGKKIPKEIVEKVLQTKIDNDLFLKGVENPAHRKIYCIETGEYYDIASNCQNLHKNMDLSAVIKCCKGKTNSAYGFHFLYAENISHDNIIDKMNKNTDQHHKKLVLCVELNKVFNSTIEASNYFKVNASTISNACHGRIKKIKGYTFKYINDKDEYMGTNFYLITQSKEIRNKFFTDSDYELTDEPIWGYEVHIAKTSFGWKTLWEDHSFYHSVEELRKFYKKHKTYIYIYDEYNKFYTWEDFEKRVINWENEQPVRYMKYVPEGNYNEIFGGKDYLTESTEDDYDIKMPYDHVEYHKLDPYNEKRWIDESREPMYFHDKDGYDFTKGRFS